ncbi:hypothetical protein A2Z33_02310, partial [Candidatus Gottesmanbacteria bacterium RBG_16_52_11]
MARRIAPYGLGVHAVGNTVYLYYNSLTKKTHSFLVESSGNGFDFVPFRGTPVLAEPNQTTVDSRKCSDFRFSVMRGKYLATYLHKSHPFVAVSDDLVRWKVLGEIVLADEAGVTAEMADPCMIVPDIRYKGKAVMYYGHGSIRVAYSSDLVHWTPGETVLAPRPESYDAGDLSVGTIFPTDRGLAVVYYVRGDYNGTDSWALGTAVFDKNNPAKLVWRSTIAILENIEGLATKQVSPVGLVHRDNTLISYWDVQDDGIVAIAHPVTGSREDIAKGKKLKLVLEKITSNPILKPIASHLWESKAVFNPAAIYENGRIHLIYRAVGDNDVSVLGYASSVDGVNFDVRHPEPIYVPTKDFELSTIDNGGAFSSPYFSGGAYGGVEDPRVTRINDTYYMMYVAYNGRTHPRVAMTSIPVSDFHNGRWDRWKEPVLVSPPGVVDKNACVLPEKVNGKYVVFHRIFPNILVDYVDDLEAFDGKSRFLKGDYFIPPRYTNWDSRKLGIGAPPIKTDKGWLLIYQAVD